MAHLKRKLALIGAASLSVASLATVSAAQADDDGAWNSGFIIADENMYVSEPTMSEEEIRSFLQTQGQNCTSSGNKTCLKDYVLPQTRTIAGDSESGCAGYEAGENEDAARVIYKVSASCKVAAQVLLVTLQKEQSLITLPRSEYTYNKATGYACPDHSKCDSAYFGLQNQVYRTAWALQRYRKLDKFRRMKSAGQVVPIKYCPAADCESENVLLHNDATAALYLYTPYVPNEAVRAGSKTDEHGSWGNWNFFNYYKSWFGNPRVVKPKQAPAVATTAPTEPSAPANLNASTGTQQATAEQAPDAQAAPSGPDVISVAEAVAEQSAQTAPVAEAQPAPQAETAPQSAPEQPKEPAPVKEEPKPAAPTTAGEVSAPPAALPQPATSTASEAKPQGEESSPVAEQSAQTAPVAEAQPAPQAETAPQSAPEQSKEPAPVKEESNSAASATADGSTATADSATQTQPAPQPGIDFALVNGKELDNAQLLSGTLEFAPGSEFELTLAGLVPGTRPVVTLHSTPTVLSTGVVAADGTLQVSFPVPAEAGAHSLTVTPEGATQATTVLKFTVPQLDSVVSARSEKGTQTAQGAQLANSGSTFELLLLVSVSLLGLGGGAFALRRQTR